MSVRIFSQELFYDELKKCGFQPTETKTNHFTIWKNENGDCLSVNHGLDAYPYTYLNDLLGSFGANYNFSGARIADHTYKITESEES